MFLIKNYCLSIILKQTAYIASKLLFYLYLSLYIFIMVFSILSYFEYKFGIQIPFVEIIDNRPKVHVPVLGLGINIPLNSAILIMWTSMLYYAIYFYALKEFLRVFVAITIFLNTQFDSFGLYHTIYWVIFNKRKGFPS
jgi:hypothetical protein